MPPRQHRRDTDITIRQRNVAEIVGWPGMTGRARVGSIPGRGAGQLSVVSDGEDETGESSGAAQLLVMSATGASTAIGGGYVEFDQVVAQHGFDGVVQPSGGYWVHPLSGVYLLNYEHAWDDFDGGGTIQLELDDVPLPEGVIASGDAGSSGRGAIAYIADAGSVGRIRVTHGAPAGLTYSATVHVAITDPDAVDRSSLLLDTFYVDSRLHSQDPAHNSYAESAVTLESGVTYSVVVDGNYTRHASALELGSPDSIMYLSPGLSQRDAGQDAETLYADDATGTATIGHTGWDFQLNTGSGWAHVEPDGGPFTTPQAGHSYTYSVTGEGSPLRAAITDTPISDNNGRLRVRIFSAGGG